MIKQEVIDIHNYYNYRFPTPQCMMQRTLEQNLKYFRLDLRLDALVYCSS